MSSDVSAVTKLLPTVNEGFITTLNGAHASGATTINLTSVSGLTDGSVFVGIVEPGDAVKQQVFTGTVDLAGSRITGVVYTRGTSATGHGTGATVVDYTTGTHFNMLSKAVQAHANQDGSLKTAAVKTALGVTSAAGGGWDILNGGTAPTTATGYNKGNKEFNLTFSGVDLSGALSAGMRLKFDRSATAPTQCMSFSAASSQYATKATPSGITFTAAFSIEAWVYLKSYGSSNTSTIIRRYASGNGFGLRLSAGGQVDVFYAAGSNLSEFTTYQSLPLNRWVHVAAVVTSTSARTCFLYINGVQVPNFVATSAATSLVQATTDLRVGASETPTEFFDGNLSEVRVWSTGLTQTQILDNMAISLTGSETNLVALYQGNGNFNDKTANANNLTASGGAAATTVDNPYHATEYAVVTKVAYAGGTTTVTVFSGDYVVPLATMLNPYSSYQRTPFGFPASRGKWRVEALVTAQISQSNGGVWQDMNFHLVVPTGDFIVGYQGNFEFDPTTQQALTVWSTLSTAANIESDRRYSQDNQIPVTSAAVSLPAKMDLPQSLTTQTPYYLNMKATNTAGNLYVRGDISIAVIYAECALI